MNGVLTAANINFRSIGGNFTNFYRSASSVDRVSQEIYSQQAFYIYYTYHLVGSGHAPRRPPSSSAGFAGVLIHEFGQAASGEDVNMNTSRWEPCLTHENLLAIAAGLAWIAWGESVWGSCLGAIPDSLKLAGPGLSAGASALATARPRSSNVTARRSREAPMPSGTQQC